MFYLFMLQEMAQKADGFRLQSSAASKHLPKFKKAKSKGRPIESNKTDLLIKIENKDENRGSNCKLNPGKMSCPLAV